MQASLLLVVMLVECPMLLVAAEEAVGPLNDDFDNATVVIEPLPIIDAIDTTHATTAADDPSCAGHGHTVWYAYTPSADITIKAHTLGSDYATTLSVYTGESGALTQIACDSGEGLGPAGVTVDATGGTTYYFMVASLGEEPGGALNFTVIQQEEAEAGDPPCPLPPAPVPQDGRTCTVCVGNPAQPVAHTWGFRDPKPTRNKPLGPDVNDDVTSFSCAAAACANQKACSGLIPKDTICTIEATITVATGAPAQIGSGTNSLACTIYGNANENPPDLEVFFRIVVRDRQ